MDKIKVVMVGIGHHHAEGVMQELHANPLFEVVGYVENDDKIYNENCAKDAFRNLKRLDEQEIIEDETVEGIIVECIVSDIVKEAKKYLVKKCPIHIDKPAGYNFSEFKEFIEVARENNILIQTGYMYRYNPAVQESLKILRGQCADKKIGNVYEVDAVMNTEHDPNFRKWLKQFPSGTMFIFGCHMIDFILLFHGIPSKVHSYIKQSGFDHIEVDDVDMAVFEYKNGTSIARAVSVEANGYGRRQLIICGSEGTIEIEPLENPTTMSYSMRDGKDTYSDKKQWVDLSKYGGKRRYEDMMDDFARMVRGKEIEGDMIFPIDYDYEMNLQKIVLQACNVVTV